MENELLYSGIENLTPCSCSSLYLSIVLSFKAKFVSQFSPELCKLESSNVVHTFVEWVIASWDWNSGSWLLFFHFSSVFLSFPKLQVNINKFNVGVFSGTFKARILKLGIHIANELLYCGIENRTPCSYSSLYLSIFLSFKAKFVSQTVQARIFKCGIHM